LGGKEDGVRLVFLSFFEVIPSELRDVKGKVAEGTVPVALYICGVEGLEYIGVPGVWDGKAWLILF